MPKGIPGSSPSCSIEGCQRPHKGHGLCNTHNERRRRHGSPLTVLPSGTPAVINAGSCAVETCQRPAWSRGWCQPHYFRWYHHGDVRADVPLREAKPDGARCAIEGCDQPLRSRGAKWCAKHYHRWYRSGDPMALIYAPPETLPDACVQCSALLTGARVSWIYCSPRCEARARRGRSEADRVCPECSAVIPGSAWATQVWCSRPCKDHARGRAWSGRLLAARMGWRCRLCDEAIESDRRWPDPFSVTADHIVPVALGGDDKLANLQPAHARCNIVKGPRAANIR